MAPNARGLLDLPEELLTIIVEYDVNALRYPRHHRGIVRLRQLRRVHPVLAYLDIIVKNLFPVLHLRPSDQPEGAVDIRSIAPYVHRVSFRPAFVLPESPLCASDAPVYGLENIASTSASFSKLCNPMLRPLRPRWTTRGHGIGRGKMLTPTMHSRYAPSPSLTRKYLRIMDERQALQNLWQILKQLPNLHDVAVESPADSSIFQLVVRSIAAADLELHHLTIKAECGENEPRYDWVSTPSWGYLDLTKLKTARLSLDVVKMTHCFRQNKSEPGQSLAAISQICAESLEELEITNNIEERSMLPYATCRNPNGCAHIWPSIVSNTATLWKDPGMLSMPRLHKLELTDCQINAERFASWISGCTNLQHVSFNNVTLFTSRHKHETTITDWQPIFEAIGCHSQRIQSEFKEIVFEDTIWEPLSWSYHPSTGLARKYPLANSLLWIPIVSRIGRMLSGLSENESAEQA